MLLFDAHLDLALNAVDWNRDLRQSVDEIRAHEQSVGMKAPGRGTNTVSLPELRKANVGICVTTLLARQEKEINHDFGHTTYESCYAFAHAHLSYYRAMQQAGWLRLIHSKSDLQHHFHTYQANPETEPLGIILAMEGADPLLKPSTIEEFHELGLRSIGLTHYGANRYGGGTRTEVGLAVDAIELLEQIERLGMTVDMTHLSDVAFWQVAKRFSGRIHASHQNSRKICDWQRQFSDEQYRVVIERDGVVGMAFDIIMLQPGYVRGQSPRQVSMVKVIENIDIVCQLAGNALHVGIGSDLDGGYGCEQTPTDVDRISDLQRLPELLALRGYPESDIRLIMHGNWLRFYSEILPES